MYFNDDLAGTGLRRRNVGNRPGRIRASNDCSFHYRTDRRRATKSFALKASLRYLRINTVMKRAVSAGLCTGVFLLSSHAAWAQTPTAPRFLTFAFANERHGWAGGAAGIAVTNDGGHTWQSQYSGGRVDELAFVHRKSLFALVDGNVLHTGDDGDHWETPGQAQPALKQFAFATDRNGFGVGVDGRLYATSDGARTWRRAAFDKPVNAVCFSDRRAGYVGGATTAPALGGFDGIAATRDGGRTWAQATRPPTDGLVGIFGHTLHCTRGSVYDVIDLGARAGGGAYVLARSTNGARNWTPLATGGQVPRIFNVPLGPGSEATSMSAYSPQAAYIAGFCAACGTIGQSSFGGTIDSGSTWHNTTLNAIGFTSAPVFTTPEHGWIGARVLAKSGPPTSDEVLETRDAGQTWKAIYVAPAHQPMDSTESTSSAGRDRRFRGASCCGPRSVA
jgi:photosystem II stability/assembly factor-like uncharacterized protein